MSCCNMMIKLLLCWLTSTWSYTGLLNLNGLIVHTSIISNLIPQDCNLGDAGRLLPKLRGVALLPNRACRRSYAQRGCRRPPPKANCAL